MSHSFIHSLTHCGSFGSVHSLTYSLTYFLTFSQSLFIILSHSTTVTAFLHFYILAILPFCYYYRQWSASDSDSDSDSDSVSERERERERERTPRSLTHSVSVFHSFLLPSLCQLVCLAVCPPSFRRRRSVVVRSFVVPLSFRSSFRRRSVVVLLSFVVVRCSFVVRRCSFVVATSSRRCLLFVAFAGLRLLWSCCLLFWTLAR